jgi:hypothetical protein
MISIHIEGMDFEVMSTFKFDYWKSTINTIEDIELDLSGLQRSPICVFMISK